MENKEQKQEVARLKSRTIYCDKDGVLRVCTVEVPKEPEYGICEEEPMLNCYSDVPGCVCASRWKPYLQALQHCKDTSVPFEDINAGAKLIYKQYRKGDLTEQAAWNIEKDTFYTVPEFEYEVVTVCMHDSCPVDAGCEHCKVPGSVARLTPSTSEKETGGKTLQECKDQVAKKYSYASWKEYITIRGNSTLYIPQLLNALDEAAELYAASRTEGLQKEIESRPDWSIPDENGMIDVPDDLVPLFNKLRFQLRFHTISDKNEVLTIAHMVQIAEKFFAEKYGRSRSEPVAEEQGKKQQN